jgi:hypothetical protein
MKRTSNCGVVHVKGPRFCEKSELLHCAGALAILPSLPPSSSREASSTMEGYTGTFTTDGICISPSGHISMGISMVLPSPNVLPPPPPSAWSWTTGVAYGAASSRVSTSGTRASSSIGADSQEHQIDLPCPRPFCGPAGMVAESKSPCDLGSGLGFFHDFLARQVVDLQRQVDRSSALPSQKDCTKEAIEIASVVAAMEAEAGRLASARAIVERVVALSDILLQTSTAIVMPEVGLCRSLIELSSGRSLLTGEALTPFQRGVEVLAVVAIAGGSTFSLAARMLDRLARSRGPLSQRAHRLLDVIRLSDRQVLSVGAASDGHISAIRSRSTDLPNTVWKVLEVGEMYPRTTIPRTFTLQIDNRVWLVPENATKHMWQFSQSRGNMMLKTPISSLASSIQDAMKLPAPFAKQAYMVGDWHLVLKNVREGEYIVHHALYSPKM